jgi:hypothetical protein
LSANRGLEGGGVAGAVIGKDDDGGLAEMVVDNDCLGREFGDDVDAKLSLDGSAQDALRYSQAAVPQRQDGGGAGWKRSYL